MTNKSNFVSESKNKYLFCYDDVLWVTPFLFRILRRLCCWRDIVDVVVVVVIAEIIKITVKPEVTTTFVILTLFCR